MSNGWIFGWPGMPLTPLGVVIPDSGWVSCQSKKLVWVPGLLDLQLQPRWRDEEWGGLRRGIQRPRACQRPVRKLLQARRALGRPRNMADASFASPVFLLFHLSTMLHIPLSVP